MAAAVECQVQCENPRLPWVRVLGERVKLSDGLIRDISVKAKALADRPGRNGGGASFNSHLTSHSRHSRRVQASPSSQSLALLLRHVSGPDSSSGYVCPRQGPQLSSHSFSDDTLAQGLSGGTTMRLSACGTACLTIRLLRGLTRRVALAAVAPNKFGP
jgi:hypothetical protein